MKWFLPHLLLVLAIPCWGKSLYSESTYQPLVSSTKAAIEGDLLTVVIYESATASASTDSDASTSAAVGLTASDGTTDLEGMLGLKNNFDGGGAINRTGKIAAQVTARVVEVDQDGLLKIEGEQEIVLNSEIQVIKVSGFVRPLDIDENNVILSPRIGNSKIEFIGEGILSNSEKPGWITRFFQWLF